MQIKRIQSNCVSDYDVPEHYYEIICSKPEIIKLRDGLQALKDKVHADYINDPDADEKIEYLQGLLEIVRS